MFTGSNSNIPSSSTQSSSVQTSGQSSKTTKRQRLSAPLSTPNSPVADHADANSKSTNEFQNFSLPFELNDPQGNGTQETFEGLEFKYNEDPDGSIRLKEEADNRLDNDPNDNLLIIRKKREEAEARQCELLKKLIALRNEVNRGLEEYRNNQSFINTCKLQEILFSNPQDTLNLYTDLSGLTSMSSTSNDQFAANGANSDLSQNFEFTIPTFPTASSESRAPLIFTAFSDHTNFSQLLGEINNLLPALQSSSNSGSNTPRNG